MYSVFKDKKTWEYHIVSQNNLDYNDYKMQKEYFEEVYVGTRQKCGDFVNENVSELQEL